MFCGECGTENAETRNFCSNCGKALRKAQPAPVPQAPRAAAVPVPAQQPVPVPLSSPVTPPLSGMPAPAKPPLNKGLLALGIAGIIMGMVSWFLYPYISGLLAIVMGVLVIAKSENRKGTVAIVAALAILIGLSCIVVDLFYFTIFPVPKPVF